MGAGSVGTSIAYASMIRGSARQIALYDINTKKVDAEVRDLAHGTQFTPTSQVTGGSDIEVVKDSSVIIITAGARQKPGPDPHGPGRREHQHPVRSWCPTCWNRRRTPSSCW